MEKKSLWASKQLLSCFKTTRNILNPNVHYSVQKSPTLVPTLRHIIPAHAPISLLEDLFNIVFPSNPKPTKLLLSLRGPHKILYASLLSDTYRMPHPSQSS
jgi:hypothetical protein